MVSLLDSCAPFAGTQRVESFDELPDERILNIEDPTPLPDEIVGDREVIEIADNFVASLPAGAQRLVHSLYRDEKSQAQVAAELGVSRAAVNKALASIFLRGRQALSENDLLPFAE